MGDVKGPRAPALRLPEGAPLPVAVCPVTLLAVDPPALKVPLGTAAVAPWGLPLVPPVLLPAAPAVVAGSPARRVALVVLAAVRRSCVDPSAPTSSTIRDSSLSNRGRLRCEGVRGTSEAVARFKLCGEWPCGGGHEFGSPPYLHGSGLGDCTHGGAGHLPGNKQLRRIAGRYRQAEASGSHWCEDDSASYRRGGGWSTDVEKAGRSHFWGLTSVSCRVSELYAVTRTPASFSNRLSTQYALSKGRPCGANHEQEKGRRKR